MMRPSGPVTIDHRWGKIFDNTEFEFELILIQGMNSEAVMIETFIRGLLAGRQGKDSSEGRSLTFHTENNKPGTTVSTFLNILHNIDRSRPATEKDLVANGASDTCYRCNR